MDQLWGEQDSEQIDRRPPSRWRLLAVSPLSLAALGCPFASGPITALVLTVTSDRLIPLGEIPPRAAVQSYVGLGSRDASVVAHSHTIDLSVVFPEQVHVCHVPTQLVIAESPLPQWSMRSSDDCVRPSLVIFTAHPTEGCVTSSTEVF